AGTGWLLTRLDLPPPPIDPAIAAFTKAWNAKDLAGLTALFQESMRPRLHAYLDQLSDRRGWKDGYPHATASRTVPIRSRFADVWLDTASDSFRTRWGLDDDDRWLIVTLDPPKQ